MKRTTFSPLSPPKSVQFYTMAQVAKMLAVSTRSVQRLIKQGDLPAHRFGDSVRIAHADLMAFIATH